MNTTATESECPGGSGDTAASLINWSATDWDHLRGIWSELQPSDVSIASRYEGRDLSAREAGYVFERWILEAFRLSDLKVHPSFTVPLRGDDRTREQHDGLVIDGWQGFLIESKFWRDTRVDFGPISLLHYHVSKRPAGTLGLFFSVSGYTPPAVELATGMHPMNVLLFQRADLEWGLKEGDMKELVRRKWLLALRSGGPNLGIAGLQGETDAS